MMMEDIFHGSEWGPGAMAPWKSLQCFEENKKAIVSVWSTDVCRALWQETVQGEVISFFKESHLLESL